MSDKALQTVEKRTEVKGRGQRERYTQLIAEFQRTTRKDQKVLSEQCKEIEGNNRMGKTRDLKKIGDTKGTFHARMGTIKDRKSKALTEAKEITQITRKEVAEYMEELYKKGLNDPDNHDGLVPH